MSHVYVHTSLFWPMTMVVSIYSRFHGEKAPCQSQDLNQGPSDQLPILISWVPISLRFLKSPSGLTKFWALPSCQYPRGPSSGLSSSCQCKSLYTKRGKACAASLTAPGYRYQDLKPLFAWPNGLYFYQTSHLHYLVDGVARSQFFLFWYKFWKR